MKKINLLLIAIIVFASFANAQDRMLSIDDIFDPEKRVPFSGRPIQIRGWSKDGASYLQFVGGQMLRVNPATGQTSPLYDSKKLVSILTQTPGFTLDEANKIGQALPQFNKDETAILINHNNDLWIYDIVAGTVKKITDTSVEEELEGDFSPDGKMVSFVRGMNLYVVTLATGKSNQLTRDGDEKILNGYLDWVYEEELYGRGNKRGYWWSPDSTKIAFLRTDESPVPKFVLVDDTETDQRVENTDYPQAGDPNPLVTLGIADVTKTSIIPNIGRLPKVGAKIPRPMVRFGDVAKFVDLKKYDPKNFLISRVAWSPDSRAVVFQAQDREQTFLDLNSADANGKVTTLFTERTRAWVEAIDNPEFLSNGTAVWQSERNGFKHLYHYDSSGKLIRQITDGRWEISSFYGVDEKNGFAYFSAIGEGNDWINTHIYRAKLDGSGMTRLTKTPGTHRASFNPTFTHFVDVWSDVNTPPQTSLYRADGTLEKVLDENKVPVLGAYKLGKPEFLKVKTRDGFEMEAMRILPPDFDPNKKYPVFAYTYSGPHAPQVRNQWGGNRLMWHQMLAQKGYIIWVCDNRTGSGKGVESTWPVYRSMGQTETMDLDDGFSYLKSLPYVDGERLGMWGWSYGGYMTSYFMTRTKTLKLGIAGGLVGDWALYDSIYTERYMRTPQNNPDGYAKGSVIANAKDLNGKLLIIHGAIDDNVHMQNATKLIFELQKAGKQFEFMKYPTQRHGVVNPRQAKHMYQMMTNFVEKNL
ncbi:MAG: S9 family peptidase [Acidobacteria bacterium]|nr:S9 family peptidase [Acidobacteriota bacterium]